MSTIGWIIVAVIVVVVLLALAMWWRSRHRAQLSARADELRVEARSHSSEIGANRDEAREAKLRAEHARLEAERAQRKADEASTALAQEEAAHEDKLREADRLDPAVDHRADDYDPTLGGSHRAEE